MKFQQLILSEQNIVKHAAICHVLLTATHLLNVWKHLSVFKLNIQKKETNIIKTRNASYEQSKICFRRITLNFVEHVKYTLD